MADISLPPELTYKAEIHQNSDLDWQNVDFISSVSNPNKDINLPALTPWHIDVYSEGNGLFFSKSEKNFGEEYKSKSQLNNPDKIGNVNILGIKTRFAVKLPYTIKHVSKNNILTLQTK